MAKKVWPTPEQTQESIAQARALRKQAAEGGMRRAVLRDCLPDGRVWCAAGLSGLDDGLVAFRDHICASAQLNKSASKAR